MNTVSPVPSVIQWFKNFILVCLIGGASFLMTGCNTTSQTLTQEPASKEISQETIKKIEPYLVFNVQHLLEISNEGQRKLFESELSFAKTSIEKSNMLVLNGEYQYGALPQDALVLKNSHNTNLVQPQARTGLDFYVWWGNGGCMEIFYMHSWWWGWGVQIRRAHV